MRICLVAHGFPPSDRTGVENYTEALARSFARLGHDVSVFAPRADPLAPNESLREEARDGYRVFWVARNAVPRDPRAALDAPGVGHAFEAVLEHERPQVVHFQHALKVGLSCLRAAHARGLPVVYTAHDYFPICHRYTLLRPDLSSCDVRGDSMACARCDLAVERLNRLPALGDYQAGAWPAELPPAEREALLAILDDDAEQAGVGADEEDAAFDRRRELDALRARSFAQTDLVLAPSAYLARELVRGGIDERRIEVLAYGIENADLAGLPPAAPDGARPVRFGFFGGLSKHKGAHVLLEAFGRLERGRATLVLNGYSTDEPYVRALRARADAAGAAWGGPYERADLPARLAQVDVVVVPSLWVENQPIVIREAFSARRPVLASRLGAIPESVRDGTDGLLFAPGDPEDLARALRAASEHALVRRLAAGIAPVKGVEAHAAELCQRYERLVAARDARTAEGDAGLPSSVAPFAARVRALEALPSRELLARALGGLARLGAALAPGGPGPEALLARALAGSKAQSDLREARAESEWRRAEHDAMADASAALRSERDWLRSERDWLQGVRAEGERERDWLRELLGGREAEVRWLREKLDEQRAQRLRLLTRWRALAHRLDPAVREHAPAGDLAHAMLDAQLGAVRREVEALEGGQDLIVDRGLEGILGALGTVVEELRWRRDQMEKAGREGERALVRALLVRSALGRRLAGWGGVDGPPPDAADGAAGDAAEGTP